VIGAAMSGTLRFCLLTLLAVVAREPLQAAIVTTTVTATVESQYAGAPVSSLTPGDTVSFTFTYDNAGTTMHIFNPDGSIQETFDLANFPEYYFFSDITAVAFSPNIQALFAELGKTYHRPGRYYFDFATGLVNASGTEILSFQNASNAEYSFFIADIVGRTTDDGTLYFNNIEVGASSEVGFNIVGFHSTTFAVPEPSTLSLFGAGVLWLALSIRRRTFSMSRLVKEHAKHKGLPEHQ
jgi:hypothetical protein